MRQIVFGQPVHIYGERDLESLALAHSLAGLARTVVTASSETQLRQRLRTPGQHYLVLQGSVHWVGRFLTLPRGPRIAGIVAIPTSLASSTERAKLMRQGVDSCLPAAATSQEIVAALEALGRLRFNLEPPAIKVAERVDSRPTLRRPSPASARQPARRPAWELREVNRRGSLITPDGLAVIDLTTLESRLLDTLMRSPDRHIDGTHMHLSLWTAESERSRHLKMKSIYQLAYRLRGKARAIGYKLPLSADYGGTCDFKEELRPALTAPKRRRLWLNMI